MGALRRPGPTSPRTTACGAGPAVNKNRDLVYFHRDSWRASSSASRWAPSPGQPSNAPCPARGTIGQRNLSQPRAPFEGVLTEGGDGPRDRDGRGAIAALEGVTADGGDGVRDRDGGGTGAAREGATADGGDGVRGRDGGGVGAAREGDPPDGGDGPRDRDGGGAAAAAEGALANTRRRSSGS